MSGSSGICRFKELRQSKGKDNLYVASILAVQAQKEEEKARVLKRPLKFYEISGLLVRADRR